MHFESNVYALIKELKKFDYKTSSIDHIWDVIFPDKKDKWHHVRITQYHDVYYIFLIDDDSCSLEVSAKKEIKAMESFGSSSRNNGSHDTAAAWGDLIIAANTWLKTVKKDWIKANKQAHTLYPINRRCGIVPNTLIRALLPDVYQIHTALGKAKTKKFIQIVESNYFHDEKKTTRESMTANDFFGYCKIAYLASQRKDDTIDENLSGRQMYERYADGRHEGLLEISATSKKEFAAWIDGEHPKKTTGGHPWEIKRGGNTTHIDLFVCRPSHYTKSNFKVELRGMSIGRLQETINMFLALYDAGLPITISDPEGIRKRLLAQDNIGIVPCYHSLHRANQSFPDHQDVYDVLYFDDLGRAKRQIKPFITWEPLPILKPSLC